MDAPVWSSNNVKVKKSGNSENGNSAVSQGNYSKIKNEGENTYSIRFAKGEIHTFYGFDAPEDPKAGRLKKIEDRHGNSLLFSYDENGMLIGIKDSYARQITITYDALLRISTVTDFTGRQVQYTYDPDTGDLIKVRSPIIVGTPHGNDFPNGRVYQYTYNEHKLISIICPQEEQSRIPYLTNTYGPDGSVTQQYWGGTNDSGVEAGGTVYFALSSDPYMMTMTTRTGALEELLFSPEGRIIEQRRYLDGDPITTTFQYDDDGKVKRISRPEGDFVEYFYDSENPDKFQKFNLIEMRVSPGPRGADQDQIVVKYEYEPLYNKLYKVIDPRGNDSEYTPPNGGVTSPERYAATFIYDYMEGDVSQISEFVDKWDINLGSFPLNLGDINGDGVTNQTKGNLVRIDSPTVNLLSDSNQATIEGDTTQEIYQIFRYNSHSQITYIENQEGIVTEYDYYPESDPTHSGMPNPELGNDGEPLDTVTGGYLKEIAFDTQVTLKRRISAPLVQAKVTCNAYDSVGNILQITTARGVRTDYYYNALDEVIQVTRAADVTVANSNPEEPGGLTAHAYLSRVYYDANGNVVKSEVENRDGNTQGVGSYIETRFIYDILDNPVQVEQEVDTDTTLIAQYRYNENEDLVLAKSPLAVAGAEPDNQTSYAYDDLNRLINVTRGYGGPNASTVSCAYDKNSNLLTVTDAHQHNGTPDVTTFYYDGYNRGIEVRDAVGNQIIRKFDHVGNVIEGIYKGRTGEQTPVTQDISGNVELSHAYAKHDELSRIYQMDADLFVPTGVTTVRPVNNTEGGLTPGDGKITGRYEFDRLSRMTHVINDNEAVFVREFDGLSRVIKTTDPENNIIQYFFDDNSNLVKSILTEKSQKAGIADKVYTTWAVFDSLNRTIRVTDNIGQTGRFSYDSRSNLIATSDAQSETMIADPLALYSGQINADGNTTTRYHDGIGRVIKVERDLRIDGQGNNPLDTTNPANPDGKITLTQVWDENSRLQSISDDKGNTTLYGYDSLNRAVLTTFADSTTINRSYNQDNELVSLTDQNGSVFNFVYDAIHRRIQTNITPAAGLGGTTLQTYEYNGRGQVTKFTDNNDPSDSDDDSVVTRAYDSLFRGLEESQQLGNNTSKVIGWQWESASRLKALLYPNDRKIEYERDLLNRLTSIKENSNSIAGYQYIGYRLLEKTLGNGITHTLHNGSIADGWDDLGRLVKSEYRKDGDTLLSYGYGYNRVNLKLYEENFTDPARSELYSLDSSYRVIDHKQGTLNGQKNGIDGTPTATQKWTLDGVGNWETTEIDSVSFDRTVNEMNEYTSADSTPTPVDESTVAFWALDDEITEEGGEFQPDENTLSLYHLNNTTGPIVDASANGNDGRAPFNLKRGEEGLWGTPAVKARLLPIRINDSSSLRNIQDKLTVELYVFIEEGKKPRGTLVKMRGMYDLKFEKHKKKHRVSWSVRKKRLKWKKIYSDDSFPTGKWVHVAGVYDGSEISLYIDGVKQAQTKNLTGNVYQPRNSRLRIAGIRGKVEEPRISNIVRSIGSGGQGSGTVTDSSGNANHGSANGGVTSGAAGPPVIRGLAMQFDGTGHIRVQDNTNLKGMAELTVESWVYLDSKSANARIVDKRSDVSPDTDQQYTLGLDSSGDRFRFEAWNANGERAEAVSNDSAPTGSWVHVAGVYDGNEVALYVNGVKQNATDALSGNVRDAETPLHIANDPSGGGFFNGKLDSVRISSERVTSFYMPNMVDYVHDDNGNRTDDGQLLCKYDALNRLIEIRKKSSDLLIAKYLYDAGNRRFSKIVSNSGSLNGTTYFFYSGWQCIEERNGDDQITRQFVEGAGIDEHIRVDVYDPVAGTILRSRYLHFDGRANVIALSDENGNIVERFNYSVYGMAYRKTGEGFVPVDENTDTPYLFQGRRIDWESRYLYFRNRYYDYSAGRFIQRDPMGYKDSMGLYNFCLQNPLDYQDPTGKYAEYVGVDYEKLAKLLILLYDPDTAYRMIVKMASSGL